MLGSSSNPPCSLTTGKINRNSRLPSQVAPPVSCHIVLIPLGAFPFLFFLLSLFLLLFTPWPWLFPSTCCQDAQGVAGRQFAPAHLLHEICHGAQHLPRSQTAGNGVSLHSWLVSAPSSNTSLLPQHSFFRRLLPCSATTGPSAFIMYFLFKDALSQAL